MTIRKNCAARFKASWMPLNRRTTGRWRFCAATGCVGAGCAECTPAGQRWFSQNCMIVFRCCLGANLSAGQRQLLTIARVFLCDPPILILDEATSSVDTRTEVEIGKAMKQLMDGRTSFVIAHRLSTIRDADNILFMANGNIIEQGDHKTLLAKKGAYAALYYSQFE